MAAEAVTVPMAVHSDAMVMAVVMSMPIVMGVVMNAVAGMRKAVPEETVTKPVTVAPGPVSNGIALREGDEQKKSRSGGERSCRNHRLNPRVRSREALSDFTRAISTGMAIKQPA